VWFQKTHRGVHSLGNTFKLAAAHVPRALLQRDAHHVGEGGSVHISNTSARVTVMTNLMAHGASDHQIKKVSTRMSDPSATRSLAVC
jgi:hypothetical protein